MDDSLEDFNRDLEAVAHSQSLTQKIRILEVLRSNLYLDLKARDKPGLDLGPANFRVAQLLVKVIAAEADLEKQRRKFFSFKSEPLALGDLWQLLLGIPELKPLLSSTRIQNLVMDQLRREVQEEPDYENPALSNTSE